MHSATTASSTAKDSKHATPPIQDRVWFNLARNTRIGLEPAAQGATPRFVSFGIKVAPFDSAAVAAGLKAAGGEVLSVAPSLIRFRDNYGITLDVTERPPVAARAGRRRVSRASRPSR